MKVRTGRNAWLAAAAVAVVVATVLAPAGVAGKPADKQKPPAAGKTWVKLGGGKGYGTYLKLDAGFASALTGLGIAAKPLTPASDPSDTPDLGIRFPITQGKLVLTLTGQPAALTGVKGTIGHVGGLSLTKGSTVVRVRNLTLVLDASTTDVSKVTAQVSGKRIDFATLKLAGMPTITGKVVNATASDVKLTAAAATALSTAFGATISPGTLVGSATVKARLVGTGKA